MIHSVKIKGNSLLSKHWGNREFVFTEGINIIFGENGCGKSILIDTISKYVGIDKRGWSIGLDPSRITGINYKFKSYINLIEANSKLGLIDINWDGVACYKSETQRDPMSMLSNIMQGGEKEEVSINEAMNLKKNKLSSGQGVVYFLGKLINLKIPDISKPINDKKNDVWAKLGSYFSDYVSTLPRDGKPTLILDEPDKSLDFGSQYTMWTQAINKLSEIYQIIVVTHSPFALLRDDCNIIDKDDYYNKSKGFLTNAFYDKELKEGQ